MLLGVEYLALSFLVDLPLQVAAMPLVGAVRIAVPVVIAAFAAGWMVARGNPVPASAPDLPSPPPWRPWPALAAQAAAFLATALLASTLLGTDTHPPSTGWLLALFGCAAMATLLALRSTAPFSWYWALLARRWRSPIIALGLGLLAWRAAEAAESAWRFLSSGTLRATAWLLRASPFEVTVVPSQFLVGAGDFLVEVAPVCSGVDGLGLILLFQAAWLSLARGRLRFPHALVLLPLGALAALAANVLRLSILILVGAWGYPNLAASGLHSKLGWILFTAMVLGTVAIAERLRWIQRAAPRAGEASGGVPAEAGAYLGPLLAALATALVTRAFGEGSFDPWYGARVVAGAGVLLALRRFLPRPSLSWSWESLAIGLTVGAAWVAFGVAEPPAGSASAPGGHPGWAWVAVRLAGSCLLIPVIEELAFRGFLLRWLASPEFERAPPRTWTWQAVALSSLAFGAIHAHFVLGTVAGVAFAVSSLRRGRLADAVLAHAVANGVIAGAVLLGGRWDLWG